MASATQPPTKTTPVVSIILPIFNAEAFLQEALTSLQNQTYSDIEIIAVNDGSSDRSGEVLDNAAKQDPRIQVYSRDNRGLVDTLNFALSKSRGKYIARMDADDLSAPERIARQVAFLEENPDIGILGTGYFYIDQQGNHLGKRHTQQQHDDIIASFFFGNPIAHPSVMFNPDSLPENWQYDDDFSGAEDFSLWLRLKAEVRFANLPEPLLHYRLSGNSVSDIASFRQRENACKVLYLNTHLMQLQSGKRICQAIYSKTGGPADYPKFVWGCLQLLVTNQIKGDVPFWPLLTRTLAAQLSFFKKPLRSKQLIKERQFD